MSKFNIFMTNLFGANWRTTLIGLLAAIYVVVKPLLDSGAYDWKNLLYAAVIAAFGFVVKDAVVTGGSIVQPTPPIAKAVQAKETADPNSVKPKLK